MSGLRQNPRQTFRYALARHPVDAAGQTLKLTRLRNRYPQQTDDIVDQNPLQDGGTQVFKTFLACPASALIGQNR